jgi:hypothetical protein
VWSESEVREEGNGRSGEGSEEREGGVRRGRRVMGGVERGVRRGSEEFGEVMGREEREEGREQRIEKSKEESDMTRVRRAYVEMLHYHSFTNTFISYFHASEDTT